MDIIQKQRPLSLPEQTYINKATKGALGEQLQSVLNFMTIPSCILNFKVFF